MKISTEKIRRKAYELWEARGCPAGSSEQDWYRAEAQLQEAAAPSTDAGDQDRKGGERIRYGLRDFR